METCCRYPSSVRIGSLRRLRSLVVAALTTMAFGCGGGVLPEASFRELAGVPADHGLVPGDRIAVGSGESEEHGNVVIHCPADSPACVIVVAADGSVGFDPGGGVPAVRYRAPVPGSVQEALEQRLEASTLPVAVVFGGGVATCAALGCPVTDAILVDRPGDRDIRRPGEVHPRDLSGFDRLELRRGIALGRKARPSTIGGRPTFHRAFGAWMDHGFFLVETFTAPEQFIYRTAWFGNASHSGPMAPPGGTATWSGIMSGVKISPSGDTAAFVHGDSAVTVSGLDTGGDVSVEIAFTGIVNEATGTRIGDMVWRNLPLRGQAFGTDDVLFDDGAGYFRDGNFGAAAEGSVYGHVYGPGHGEVGGLFHRDGIAGAFAARRD